MGTIAIDIQSTTNVQPITETRNAIELTAEETRQFSKVLAENNNNLDIAAQKFAALKNAVAGAGAATAGAGGAGGGGATPANTLAAVPAIIASTNAQVDAMNPRLRTAASAMSRLAFESTNLGGSVQGAVRSAGMLTYSLADLTGSAGVAASAAGIGALAIVIAAGIGLWEQYGEKVDSARRKLDEINASSVGYAAQIGGNQLGAREVQIGNAFEKQVEELTKKYQPGWLMRALGGLQEATMSGTGLGKDLSKALIEALGKSVYGPEGEHALAAQQDVMRKALANAGGFAAGGGDPVTRYKAQLALIEVEREQAIKKGEMSAAAADVRAEGQRRRLREQGEDYERTIAERLSVLDNARNMNVIDAKKEASNRAYADELVALDRTTMSAARYKAVTEDIARIHDGIIDALNREQKIMIDTGRAQARSGDLNPIERIRGEIDAIEVRRKASIKAGQEAVTADKIAENEKRNLFAQTLDAAVRSSDTLGKTLKKAALDPIVSYLEGLAVQEGIKAIAHFADFDIAGGALHTAAAAAAAGGAREVAQLGGLTSGSGGHGSAGGGGSQFVPNNQNGGGAQTVIIQTVDPWSRAVVNSTIYEINRAGVLNTPIVAPYGRPS